MENGIMSRTVTARSERINLRLSETAKRRIEQAASVEGKTVSAFIVSSALARARGEDRQPARNRSAPPRGGDALLRCSLGSSAAERPAPRGPGGPRPAHPLASTASDKFVIEPPTGRHDHTAFSCGLPELDRYLARQAG